MAEAVHSERRGCTTLLRINTELCSTILLYIQYEMVG